MTKGLVSRIQSYSTHDGPGLRTSVFMMGCNLRCKWCSNPENLEMKTQVFHFNDRCQQCGLCVQKAANNSIQLAEVGVSINRELCTNLDEMVELCPFNAYERIGKSYLVDELVQRLLRDKEFYEIGQGGVTFSGGEAGLQAEFIYQVAKALKTHGIHTCLDTAGRLSSKTMERLLEVFDLVLFDIKGIDNDSHLKNTGVDNHLILENAKLIAKHKKPMIVRLVLIPEHNDDIDDIKQRIDFVDSLGSSVKQLDILKYHSYGEGKYYNLGLNYPMKKGIQLDQNLLDSAYSYAKSKGLTVTIGG